MLRHMCWYIVCMAGVGGGGNWGISKLYSQNIEVEQILSEKYLFRLTYNMTYKCAIRIKITE